MLARKMLRPAGIALLLMVLMLAFGVPALAVDNDPVEFAIEVSPAQMTEPGEAKVSLRVSNAGGEAIYNDSVTLIDPAGQVVGSFGDGGTARLPAGSSISWEGAWNVTEEELDKGEFVYTVKYHLMDAWGELVECTRQAVGRVEFTGERVKLTVGRTITPEVVRRGNDATVTYELYNSGNVDLTDITVKENISKQSQKVKSLPAGEKATLTFTTKIGSADLTSNAKITYKAKGSTKTITQNVEDETILLAKPDLAVEISTTTPGVNIGQAARLVITFTNQGNISYSNVSVKDENKGEFLTNISIPAGATVSEEKEFILTEPTTFKVTATLPDNTGATNTMVSNELSIGVFDPEREMRLTLNLTCDQQSIHQTPAGLRFHLQVTNNSNIKAENISIYHGSTFITTISALEPGASTLITRDFTVSQGGQFCFTASVQDSMKNTVTFDSNILQINYARPTAAPTKRVLVTSSPPPQVTVAPAEPVLVSAKNALTTVFTVLAVLFGAAFALFLVSTVMRIYKKSKSAAAYDHLELAERRTYTDPTDEELEEVDVPLQERPPYRQEEMAPLSHERLMQTGNNEAVYTPAVDSMPAGDGEGGYRLSRNMPADQEASFQRPVQPQTGPIPPAMESAAPQENPAEDVKQEDAPRRRSRSSSRVEDGE